ncbi:MAG: FAD-binding protein [Spirochaetales bacterium]|nr:FAD-binding protein [Spirochaetales bacterium]
MLDRSIMRKLKKITGEKGVLETPEDLAVYGYDATFADSPPDAVVLPTDTAQVSRVIILAADLGIPVIPRGMGSGLAAASVPFEGGILLTLSRMNRILEIDLQNRTVFTEAGVITAILQAEVEKLGLFYPPDPSSIKHSSIGGNIACNAGGPRCLKYGVTGDYVKGLTVVLPDGEIIKTGGKPIKDVTGYDLTSLLVGSEGTLGVVTEALLRLVSKPKFARTARVEFQTIAEAGKAVNDILSAGLVPATLELMDETAIKCVDEAMRLNLPRDVEAILIIETDGPDEATVVREIEQVALVCSQNNAREVRVAGNEAERTALWNARRSLSPSLARVAPNKLGEDITVPLSKIPETIQRIKSISRKYDLPIVIFGHAGDGNLHPNVLFDKRNKEQWERVNSAVREIFETALDVGGTLSGEHGVGALKRAYLEKALGRRSMLLQREIKAVFDPAGIMNPGKIFPENTGT